jgi:hypothetical protein
LLQDAIDLIRGDNHCLAENVASAKLAGLRAQRPLGHGQSLGGEQLAPFCRRLAVFKDEADGHAARTSSRYCDQAG